MKMTDDESAEVRPSAITLLATCNDPRILAEVESVARNDSDERIRRQAEMLARRRRPPPLNVSVSGVNSEEARRNPDRQAGDRWGKVAYMILGVIHESVIAAWACPAHLLRHNPYVTKRGASPRLSE